MNRMGKAGAGMMMAGIMMLGIAGMAFAQSPQEPLEEVITIETYFPAPWAEVDELRLYPSSRDYAYCIDDRRGTMYYDEVENKVKVCKGTIDGWQELWAGKTYKFGNIDNAEAGTIRFTGTDFEGYNGSDWVSFTSGSSIGVCSESGSSTFSSPGTNSLTVTSAMYNCAFTITVNGSGGASSRAGAGGGVTFTHIPGIEGVYDINVGSSASSRTNGASSLEFNGVMIAISGSGGNAGGNGPGWAGSIGGKGGVGGGGNNGGTGGTGGSGYNDFYNGSGGAGGTAGGGIFITSGGDEAGNGGDGGAGYRGGSSGTSGTSGVGAGGGGGGGGGYLKSSMVSNVAVHTGASSGSDGQVSISWGVTP